VCLQANAINLDASGFERLDEVESGRGLGAGVFYVIVIVVELHGRVCSRGGLKGDEDVFGADGIVEYVCAVGAVVIEGFVYNIPSVAFAFVVRDFIGNVVL